MKRVLHAAAFTTLLAAVSFHTSPALELYFIGNSLTYVNDIPRMVDSLGSGATPPVAIHSRHHMIGNSELNWHYTPDCLDTIKNGGFDYVVLQGYLDPYLSPEMFYSDSRRFNDTITMAGAQTAFFMTWAPRTSRSNFDTLAHSYDSMGTELGALVAPAGRAWETIFQSLSDQQFYSDDVHATVAGSYLAACVIFATLTGQSPAGNTYDPIDTPYVFGSWPSNTCDSTGEALQRLAWETAGGYNPQTGVDSPPLAGNRLCAPRQCQNSGTPRIVDDMSGDPVNAVRMFDFLGRNRSGIRRALPAHLWVVTTNAPSTPPSE